MACTARGSCTVAMTRSRPPQRGQARTSKANTRRIRAAQVHAPGATATRGLVLASCAFRSGSPIADDLRAPPSMRGVEAVVQEQVHGGPRDDGRELLQESMGSKSKCNVPSRHTVLSATRT